MKLFNKTAIALSLSILGAASSVSALAMVADNTQLQEVEVRVDGDANKNMNVFVSVDGEITTADVSPLVMGNPDELRKLLNDVPEDLREKLIESLVSTIDQNGNFKVVVGSDVNQELHLISEGDDKVDRSIEVIADNDENKVIVMEFDHNSAGIITDKVIKKMMHSSIKPSLHKNVQFIHQGSMSAGSLMRMIKHSDFTADELNEIQQALDEKR